MGHLILARVKFDLADPQLLFRRFLLSFSPAWVKSTLANTRLFFIVGMGRSGTMFLSNLLNEVPKCTVYHETPSDRHALVDAYWNPDKAKKYLDSRERLVAARIIQSRCQIYGEVNSYLRHHVDALQIRWQPIILHLVRDGRSVVRSLMNRASFSPADKNHTGRLAPHPNDPLADQWPDMDRFGRVCWYWAYTNEYLLERKLSIVRFEDITSSYDQFVQQVLQPLGVSLSFETWNEEVLKPKNVSQDMSFPAWKDWTQERKRQFEAICGAVMSDLGYV